jgi:leader peptidase (prepilin peptidase) / N-methyltransferase
MGSSAIHPTLVVIAGILGLAIGSFLNVFIYRVPRGMSVVHPASHCPMCNTPLRAVENVPVLSWIALRGRCGHCGAQIPLRYPVIELLCGTLFAAMAAASGSWEPLPTLLALVTITLAASGIDVEGLPVPPWLELSALVAAASLVVVSAVSPGTGRLGWGALGGGVAAAAYALGAVVREPSRLDGRRRVGARLGSVGLWISWGWTAGWLWGPAGLVTGLGLAVAAVAPIPHQFGRRKPPTAVVGTFALLLIMVAAAVGT